MSRWKRTTHCKICQKELTPWNTQFNGHTSSGRCKDCNAKLAREYRANDKDRARSIHLKNRYGISLEEYETLMKLQNESCAICGSNEKLSVDHNHKTEQVRGLLCHKCNAAIGFVDENLDRLEKMRNYLMKYMDLPKVEDNG